jgi:hypothetical protein
MCSWRREKSRIFQHHSVRDAVLDGLNGIKVQVHKEAEGELDSKGKS